MDAIVCSLEKRGVIITESLKHVLANNDFVKSDSFVTSPKDWIELVNMDINFNPTEYRRIRLIERMVEIEILIQTVRDNLNNFEISGKFYDNGNWYHLQIFYFKSRDVASIRFVPRPISTATFYDQPYIEHCRKTKVEPSI